MAFERLRATRQTPDVDLTPVMNLFVVMIPFLMLSAAFVHVAIIPTALPSAGDAAPGTPEDALTVSVRVDADGLHLTATHPTLDAAALDALAVSLPKQGDAWDLDGLGRTLRHLKQRWPKSDTLVVLAGTDVRYHEVVAVLDASREHTVDAGTPRERHEPLFPVVVLSRAGG